MAGAGVAEDSSSTRTVTQELPQSGPSWEQVVQGHEIDDARLLPHSTDQFAVIKYDHPEDGALGIALYSVKDKACYKLPPFTNAGSEIPDACRCVTLHGKIYLLGGVFFATSSNFVSSDEVYVLDVVGQRQWKRCANMSVPRHEFECGVMNGKIYVFGGITLQTSIPAAEMYDPEVDAWTAIKPMISARFGHQVGQVGNELLVYGGKSFSSDLLVSPENKNASLHGEIDTTDYWEIYNPALDTWRIWAEAPWSDPISETFFLYEGKLHSMAGSDIFVLDVEKQSRSTSVQTFSNAIEGTPYLLQYGPTAIVPMDGELLAIIRFQREPFRIREWAERFRGGSKSASFDVLELFQSRGFGVHGREFVWERANWPHSFEGLLSPFVVPLGL